MKSRFIENAALLATFSGIVILNSCSSGPPAPQPGSPEYLWNSAKQTSAAGDYMKTSLSLDKLASGQSDYTGKAQAWLLVMTGGMIKGYSDLADSFDQGAKNNRAEPLTFRTKAANYRRTAGRLSTQFAEAYQRFTSNKLEQVPIALGVPKGNAAVPAQILRVEKGMVLTPGDVEASEAASVDRGILLIAARAVGAGDDAAKAAELLKNPDLAVPRNTFLMAMATSLYDQAELYSSKKLDDPSKVKTFCGQASDILKQLPASKETKELDKKIQALAKKTR